MKPLSGKLKKCKECRNWFKPVQTFQAWCSPDCGLKLARKAQQREKQMLEREQRQREKEQRKRDREWKEANRTRGDLTKKAQDAVNEYIRWRDYFKPCISCGTCSPDQKFGGAWDAGHYRSVGSSPHTRFVLLNIWKQCKQCNDSRRLSGNSVEYRKNLVAKLGEDRVLKIEHDNTARHYSKDDLRRIAKIFRKRARWYKKLRLKQSILEA